jgi:predicted HAD superfamily Cof-like phosphohydrolase
MDYETFFNEAASLHAQDTLSFEAWLKKLAETAAENGVKFTDVVSVVYAITKVRISTDEWFEVVLKNDPPGMDRFHVQLGNHVEEVAEMLQEVYLPTDELNQVVEEACAHLTVIAKALKSGNVQATVDRPKKFEDSLLDQLVTGKGLLKMRGADIAESVARVDVANFTKFVDGKPVYQPGGKVGKGPNFWNPEG